MRTRNFQIFWLVVASLFVAAFMWFVTDSLAVTVITGAFTGVVGIFLGKDIATMILKTKAMKPGDYKPINTARYTASFFIFLSLLIEAFAIAHRTERDMSALYLCFGLGALVVIGGLVNGIECNKLCTKEAKEKQCAE
jgi:hypothetical protein